MGVPLTIKSRDLLILTAILVGLIGLIVGTYFLASVAVNLF